MSGAAGAGIGRVRGGETAAGHPARDGLEDLQAEPDQLLAYHFWAEDAGADGTLRRISSDMFFAEVRPFEEIFRQGQPPPGGASQQQQQQQQGGGAQAAQQLAELQKEIINATWKLIRREGEGLAPGNLAEDVQLIGQSQASALEKATALGQQLENPSSQQDLNEVLRHMQQSLRHLLDVDGTTAAETLPKAHGVAAGRLPGAAQAPRPRT